MEKTAFQKIVDRNLVRILPDGRYVLKLTRLWGHEITTPNAIMDMQLRNCDVVFNPNKIKTMIDHVNPAKDTDSAIQGQMMRKWSRKHGIEFYDTGRNGVCHALIPETGLVRPGDVGIMGDSHTCTHGAFCALAAGVGTTDLESGIITGLWVCAPQKVIRVNFNGILPDNVFSKDLILSLIKQITVKGATNSIIEFGGPVIDAMSMEARLTMPNMAVEAGATSGMMMVDDTTCKYLMPAILNERRLKGLDANEDDILQELYQFNSDPGAVYDEVIDIDVTNMVPVTTIKYSPGDVVSVSDLEGSHVDQVYIGSCTNGRIEDLAIAASIFSQLGGKVPDGVRCIITPATQRVYQQALERGYLSIFANAGCYVSGPTCGACLGMSNGVLASGEVCVSTTNRNFNGRMGKGGMVHLASPATAAFTAIHGKITVPDDDICRRARNMASLIRGEASNLSKHEEVPFVKPDYAELYSRVASGTVREFSGSVFYLPIKDVNTDQIIPAKYLNLIDLADFGQHCLEDAPLSDEDRKNLLGKKILVARENFGCGSSREHAVWTFAGIGICCVIAPSFARIFKENMFANGYLCIELPVDEIELLLKNKEDNIFVDLENLEIHCGSGKPRISFNLSSYERELIEAGGSPVVMLQLAAELQAEGKI